MIPLMTSEAVAEYLHVDKSTLARFRAQGEGPDYIRISNGTIRYRQEDVDAWLRKVRIGTPKRRLIVPIPDITAETDDVLIDEIAMEIRHPGGRTPEEIAQEVLALVRGHSISDASYGTMLEPYEEVFP
jgi:predicted DNA-binding transcriptional regulator AlpA